MINLESDFVGDEVKRLINDGVDPTEIAIFIEQMPNQE